VSTPVIKDNGIIHLRLILRRRIRKHLNHDVRPYLFLSRATLRSAEVRADRVYRLALS